MKKLLLLIGLVSLVSAIKGMEDNKLLLIPDNYALKEFIAQQRTLEKLSHHKLKWTREQAEPYEQRLLGPCGKISWVNGQRGIKRSKIEPCTKAIKEINKELKALVPQAVKYPDEEVANYIATRRKTDKLRAKVQLPFEEEIKYIDLFQKKCSPAIMGNPRRDNIVKCTKVLKKINKELKTKIQEKETTKS